MAGAAEEIEPKALAAVAGCGWLERDPTVEAKAQTSIAAAIPDVPTFVHGTYDLADACFPTR